jgi:hypothetical protein
MRPVRRRSASKAGDDFGEIGILELLAALAPLTDQFLGTGPSRREYVLLGKMLTPTIRQFSGSRARNRAAATAGG